MSHSPQQIQGLLQDKNQSAWRKYATLTVGEASLSGLLKYELLTTFFGSIPGALGFALRRVFYRSLFARCGRGVMIGRNVTLRGAGRITLGNGVLVDDNVVLDARGAEARIELGDGVVLSRNTIVRTRGRELVIGAGSDIGCNCIVATDSRLVLGREVLVAAFTYITAGGNHNYERRDVPVIAQGFTSLGGVTIGDGAWIGAHSTVMDGVVIGTGAIVGAHSLVRGPIPEYAIAYGTPCRVQGQRPG